MSKTPQETAGKILETKHPNANCLILAGSVMRGEGTPFSDLDVVILYDKVDHAFRESFIFDEWRIETFVHDFSTLKYFSINLDKNDGKPSLPHMVSEGMVIPSETDLSKKAKSFAKELLANGPPSWTENDIVLKRYLISDKIDDIRAPRSKAELIATGTQLYTAISDFYFRSQGLWAADGKTILRKLMIHDKKFHDKFVEAFRALFEDGEQKQLIELAAVLLEPHGGFLFEGLKLEAPKDWRTD